MLGERLNLSLAAIKTWRVSPGGKTETIDAASNGDESTTTAAIAATATGKRHRLKDTSGGDDDAK